MAFKIYSYLGLVSVLILITNSAQGLKTVDCGLWVVNEKVQLRCNCDDGEIPNGVICRPADTTCPNGYFDIFENQCKCIRYENNFGCANLCDDRCENGICLGSGECVCNKGYSKSAYNICEPICYSGCKNGACIGPNKCKCDEGYKESMLGYSCEPICEYECVNGRCLSPNWCSCFVGYKRVGPNKCRVENDYDEDEDD